MSSAYPGNDGQWSDPRNSNMWGEQNKTNTQVSHGLQPIATIAFEAPTGRLQQLDPQEIQLHPACEMVSSYYPTTHFATGAMSFPSQMGASYTPTEYYYQPPSLPMPQYQQQAQHWYPSQQPPRYSHQRWTPESVPMPLTSYYGYSHPPQCPQVYGPFSAGHPSTYPESSIPAASSFPERSYNLPSYAPTSTSQPWIPPQFSGYLPYPSSAMSHSLIHPPSIPSFPLDKAETNATIQSDSYHAKPLDIIERSTSVNGGSQRTPLPPLPSIKKPNHIKEFAYPINQPSHPSDKDAGEEPKQCLPSLKAAASSVLADPGRTRKRWTREEDQIVVRGVIDLKSWELIATMLQARTASQVRLRHQNYLQFSSEARRHMFSPEEDQKILAMAAKKKRKWSELAKVMGRSHVGIKNRMYFLTRERKGSSSRLPRSEPTGCPWTSSSCGKDDNVDEIGDEANEEDDSASGEEKRKEKAAGRDEPDG